MSYREPIAVVGLGAVLPGAFTTEQFWQNLVERVDCSREVPPERWVLPPELAYRYPSGVDHVASRRGCYVDPFELDPLGLDLDLSLFPGLDPLYLMALQASRAAWMDSRTGAVDRSRVGVVLAAIALPTDGSSALTWDHYAAWLKSQVSSEPYASDKVLSRLNRMVTGLPAGIVARALGLGGGSCTLDAACASSLYALKLACDELHAGRAEAMLAGGVSRPDCLYTQMGFTALGALSPSGCCSPFDVAGDGLVVGEGAGVLTLKRLSTAIEHGDHIYGLIRAIGLSNDIGGSLLAPDSEGQLRAMRAAYSSAGWSPTEVQLVECHGTGTPMGDRVEVNSLCSLWQGLAWNPGQCGLGSVKSMIGHLLTGAGAAGMIKVLLGLQHETLPPSIHFSAPSPLIPLPGSPFRVQTEAQPWQGVGGATRKAAVSAFGFGGINAHVLVEEYREESKVYAVGAPEPARGAVAIVGMAVHLGAADGLQDWLLSQLEGRGLIVSGPPSRWNGAGDPPDGAYVDQFEMPLGGFKLPPNDIPSILPQQTLMLQVASLAAKDAGLLRQGRHERVGAIIGISLDMDTTNFQLRWCLPTALESWGAGPEALEELRQQVSAPLNATRTLGALGSIVASRIARELSLGGPSFAVSAEECSGLKALELGLRSLQQKEMDQVIVGAIDLVGDPRCGEDYHSRARPFDPESEGTAPGEGALALVLKRLEDCRADERIYAVIHGLGSSHGGGVDQSATAEAQGLAIYRAYQEAGHHPSRVGLIEATGSGLPEEDLTELAVLKAWYGGGGAIPCALTAASSSLGYTGACSGLVSLMRAASELHQRLLLPLEGYRSPVGDLSDSRLHVPHLPSRWLNDRGLGDRMAAVHSVARDGNCHHILLSEADRPGNLVPTADCGLFVLGERPLEAAQTLLRELDGTESLAALAANYHKIDSPNPVVVVASSRQQLAQTLTNLALFLRTPCSGQGGVFYRPEPLESGQLAFVYPGSGNHFAGMGRELGLFFPQVMDHLDQESEALASYLAAPWTVPYRQDWPSDWAEVSTRAIAEDLHRSIMGQVTYGLVGSDILRLLGLRPDAAIGYSLGESSSLVALRAWPDRHQVFSRMDASRLFRDELGGRCLAARRYWGIPEDQPFNWRVAVLDRPASEVEPLLPEFPVTALLIVNTDQECVVGGDSHSIAALIAHLGCTAFDIEAVPTVHCAAAGLVADEYYQLHYLSTVDPGVRYYSAYSGQSYPMTSENAAQSVLDQAVYGLNFPRCVRQAYADGVRFFVEIGPGRSCSRMIERILGDRPHFSRSMSNPAEGSEMLGLLKLLGGLIADGYRGIDLRLLDSGRIAPERHRATVQVAPGRVLPRVAPGTWVAPTPAPQALMQIEFLEELPLAPILLPRPEVPSGLSAEILHSSEATAAAHEVFLEMAQQGFAAMGQAALLETWLAHMSPDQPLAESPALWYDHTLEPIVPEQRPCWLDYEQCMEFAVGSIGKVLGPQFAEIDAHPTRVRLPDDPLMLVHRMMEVEGEIGTLGAGRLVTEHDVYPGAWYLDNQRMPVCITVEAGQADLFLSAYLGIDFQTKGQRVYRLLDATISFYRRLPTVGETVSYDIRISKFVNQGDTYLFFFEFDGTINGEPMITMRNGCAGFFEYAEIKANKGIILTAEDTARQPGQVTGDYQALVPFEKPESYLDEQVAALRAGDLAGCFGPLFAGLNLRVPPTMPSGRLKLFDRILDVDPQGGRFGLGSVLAEADVHPDDWFLTCHFVDDMVMPGTLMYECCAHTLRFLLLRMGWVGEADTYTHEPVLGIPAVLRCRGPVDVTTQKVHYQVDIKEIGYGPEPYVICDALMHADSKAIVHFADMSMRLVGLSREQLESHWSGRQVDETLWSEAQGPLINTTPYHNPETGVTYNTESILQFAQGKPSLAFGAPYQVFDEQRRIARLPRPPYDFLDRVVEINQPAFVLKAGDWIEAQYDVTAAAPPSPTGAPADWYFAANRQHSMCYAILLEVALQPCGWLAAYCGSALRSQEDVKFRNLGGTATLHRELFPEAGTVRIRVRMTRVSEAGGMIVENFDMEVLQGHTMIYQGTTYFGFFSKEALANQLGVRDAKRYQPTQDELARARSIALPRLHPLTPEDAGYDHGSSACMPGGAMQMLDQIDVYVPDGGPAGLGYLHGVKQVNPEEWFFQAHFYQDPVWPGSLGLEAFLQLLKAALLDRYPQLASTHRFEAIAVGLEHTWIYRGQVLPTNRKVEVEATVTQITDSDEPAMVADGFLVVDGLPIYEMKDFPIRLVRVSPDSGGLS